MNPRNRSSSSRDSRTARSSSTRYTADPASAACEGSVLMGGRLDRQLEAEVGLVRLGIEPKPTTVSFGDRATDHEPEPHALGFAGGHRLEEPIAHFDWNTRPRIAHLDTNRIADATRAHLDRTRRPRRGQRIDGIAQQVA